MDSSTPLLEFETIWRAWVVIENPDLVVPALANPKTIRHEGNILWMTLKSCPEVSALMQGVRWTDGPTFTGNFECSPQSQFGNLKTMSGSGGYSIDEHDLKTCSFSAYYLPEPNSQEAIDIDIVPEIIGKRQLRIYPGNRVQVSSDLIGKTIKLQTIYPKTVQLTQDAIETIRVYIMGKWGDGTAKLATFNGCSFEAFGKTLKVELGESVVEEIKVDS